MAAVALATFVPPAAAHGGGGSAYRSKVTGIMPAESGLTAEVVQGDDRLSLTNKTGKVVVVMGYEGEPYLRFPAAGGVEVNTRSPAATLNINRYGRVRLPPNADAKAEPRWLRIRDGSTYTWHDHRIHWMSTIDPPVVRAGRGSRHHIFDWSVPLLVGAQKESVRGTLDYVPEQHTSRWWLLAPAGALLGAVALFTFTSPRFKSRGRR